MNCRRMALGTITIKSTWCGLALFELTKLIARNNVSVVRMRDYEDSMKWLNDAAKLRLNPRILRKVDETKKQSPLATGDISN